MRPRIALAALVLLWTAALSTLGLWRYAIFRANDDDGMFAQILLSAFHGFSTTAESNINHFVAHFSPILFLAAPFVQMAGDVRAMIVIQALLAALVAVPVFAIARRRVGEWTSLAIAAIALCYPPLWSFAFDDFHATAFVPLFAAIFVWAIDAGRVRAGLLAALALCCTKEDQFVVVGMAGLITATVWRGDRARVQLGLGSAGIAAVLAIGYFAVLHPLMFPTIHYWSLHFYNWNFTGPTANANGFAPLSSPIRIAYLFWVFAPLLFVPLRSPLVLLAVPGLLEVLASHETITMSFEEHYVASWLAFVLAAFAAGAGDLLRAPALRVRALIAAIPVACALNLLFHDPMARWWFLYRLPNANDAELTRVLDTVPRDATLGVDDDLFAHAAPWPKASLGFNGQQYFLYDTAHGAWRWPSEAPRVRALVRNGTYRVAYDRDGIVLLERVK